MKSANQFVAVERLTKLSITSMLPSVVPSGATISKFFTIAKVTTLNNINARFLPPQIRVPAPNGIMYWCILVKFSCGDDSGFGSGSQRWGSKLSGEGKIPGSRCKDQAWVPMTVPGGRVNPKRSYPSEPRGVDMVFVVDGTTRSSRLGPAL